MSLENTRDIGTAKVVMVGGGGGASSYSGKKRHYAVNASGWSSDVDSDGYYYYTINLNKHTFDASTAINVYVAGASASTFPTDAEKAQYELVTRVKLLTPNTVRLYAEVKPTSTFYVYLGAEGGGNSSSSGFKRRYVVGSTSWSETRDIDGYYTSIITLVNQFFDSSMAVNVYVAGSGDNTFATDTQKTMYGYVERVELVSGTSVKLYAKTKPTSNFYIYVGADIDANNDGGSGGDISYIVEKQNAVITGFKKNVVDIVIGSFFWNDETGEIDYLVDPIAIGANLTSLELTQGCTIGIEDYTTYKIAFGDTIYHPSATTGWYDGGWCHKDITANNPEVNPWVFYVKRNDLADMTEADLAAIRSQFHCTVPKYEIQIADVVTKKTRTHQTAYMHLSLDDVTMCIHNLVTNNYDSIFDEPLLGYLKRLHENYGAVFSLYVFDLVNTFGSNTPTRYQKEFINNSEWLKLGFHQYTTGPLNVSYETAKTYYNYFVSKVCTLCGGLHSIDRMPRLDYYAGTLAVCQGLRDANCGIIGLLNADDSRDAYYLSRTVLDYLKQHGIYYDKTNGIAFADTVMRLDWFMGNFISQYTYNTPVEDNPYDELAYRYNQPDMGMLYTNLVIFAHEWKLYSNNGLLGEVGLIEQACKFARDYHYDFDYPQNRLQNITSFALS